MIDEIADLHILLNTLNQNVDVWYTYLNKIDHAKKLDSEIAKAIRGRLIANFSNALDTIEEYSSAQGAKLREHLMENVIYGPHVEVENGVVTQVFSIEYGGNTSDVRAGQQAAWALSDKSPSESQVVRDINWKAIYLGVPPKTWPNMDPELYNRIIDARLGVWGHKAPYWMFVEFGTATSYGKGTAYPNFPGANPIQKTKNEASTIAKDIITEYEALIDSVVEDSFDDSQIYERRMSVLEIEQEVETAWTKTFRQWGKLIQREYKVEGGQFTGKWREVSE